MFIYFQTYKFKHKSFLYVPTRIHKQRKTVRFYVKYKKKMANKNPLIQFSLYPVGHTPHLFPQSASPQPLKQIVILSTLTRLVLRRAARQRVLICYASVQKGHHTRIHWTNASTKRGRLLITFMMSSDKNALWQTMHIIYGCNACWCARVCMFVKFYAEGTKFFLNSSASLLHKKNSICGEFGMYMWNIKWIKVGYTCAMR